MRKLQQYPVPDSIRDLVEPPVMPPDREVPGQARDGVERI